jgi:hypothetical protein
MTVEVTVIAQATYNAALVPLEALRELSTGQYSVFVVKDDGTLELRLVQVGLKDLVNAEIASGVQAGEVVSLVLGLLPKQPAPLPNPAAQPIARHGPRRVVGPPPGDWRAEEEAMMTRLQRREPARQILRAS